MQKVAGLPSQQQSTSTKSQPPRSLRPHGGIYPDGQTVHSPTASRPRDLDFDPSCISPETRYRVRSPSPEPSTPIPPHIKTFSGEYSSVSGEWHTWTKFALTLEPQGTFQYRFFYEDHYKQAWGEENQIGTWTATQGGIIATTHHHHVEGTMEKAKSTPRTEFCDMDPHGAWIFFNSVYLNRAPGPPRSPQCGSPSM